jgi:5-methylcytosine-specific restriction endonuclease McrA
MAPIKRSPIRKVRSKPRPGRLKGASMEKLRKDCFERDNYQCQHQLRHPIADLKGYVVDSYYQPCGNFVTWETGHMAHIESRGRGGKDELSNVLTKCANCHIRIEHSYGPSGEKPVPKKFDTQ